jgi:polygalacturonase
MMNSLHCLATEDTITVWWEKILPNAKYHILIDGEEQEITDKTHAMIKGLKPETKYLIAVLVNGEIFGKQEVQTGKKKRILDVTKAPYFAKGDGVTMNTAMLQQAINDCKEDEKVYLPKGTYMTGALRLHSNMELYLDEGATLQGTARIEDYLPRIPSRFEGIEMECYSSLLNLGHMNHEEGANCENVLICGKGTIASGGRTLAERIIEDEREKLKDYLAELGDKVLECENNNTIPGRVRPRLINMSNCKNIRITGLTLKNGASWNVHMIYCDGITTDHCTFCSEDVWNGDGWDPDSSKNCTLFASEFFTGDDSVAIKSGKNPEGNIINRPCSYIRVFDCISRFGHGICIGSEMSGGIKDVKIWDCNLGNSRQGIEVKGTAKRGGYVKNIQVTDCIMPRVLVHAVGYNDDGISAGEAPVFENFQYDRITLTGQFLEYDHSKIACEVIDIEGFDNEKHAVRNVVFNDVTIANDSLQSITLQNCSGVEFKNLKCI